MQKSSVIGRLLFLAASALLLGSLTARAQEASMEVAAHGHGFDWLQHTQQTLEELRGKLNLLPAQGPAWDTWSGAVMQDARKHLAQKKYLTSEPAADGRSLEELATPERMARAIERLRAQTTWMQEHLVQLEAAQARTKVFYDKLDTNQKTIFDLFWHEVHHRAAGHDEDPEDE